MQLSTDIIHFNNQWDLLMPTISQTSQSLQALRGNQGKINIDFGTCRWNCDVAQGKSLLRERAYEIFNMSDDIQSLDANIVYSTCRKYYKKSDVDSKLKNLIKRIDSIWNIWCIWNLICNLLTGSSRSIKNEANKLDQLYAGHKAIIEGLKSQSEQLIDDAVTQIETEIEQCVQWIMGDFQLNENKLETDFDKRFQLLEETVKGNENVKGLECHYFQDIFMEKLKLAKASAREQIFGS